ncbi:MAG: RNA polymerase sigma factor [Spirochaetales bacterium]|nr:RNA polymerase sigma factor [Spirochaetales bacterium]
MNMEHLADDQFTELYEEIFPILIRIAYNITGSMSVSEDLCQEAFIKYLNRGAALPSKDQTRYWLIRVVKNLCFNHEKRKIRERKAYNRVLNEPKKSPASGEDEYLKKETNEIIRIALNKIPKKLRTALILREYGDLNYKEIGGILHISEGNVKVRVFRARNFLENLLDKEELYVSE